MRLPLSRPFSNIVLLPSRRRHCEERKRRSNPAFLLRQSWIASLRSQ
jgi:hypothetical protein